MSLESALQRVAELSAAVHPPVRAAVPTMPGFDIALDRAIAGPSADTITAGAPTPYAAEIDAARPDLPAAAGRHLDAGPAKSAPQGVLTLLR